LTVGQRRPQFAAHWYMLLGQLVAVSFASAYVFAALLFDKPAPTRTLPSSVPFSVVGGVFIAMAAVAATPQTIGTNLFLPYLIAFHVLILLPFLPVKSIRLQREGILKLWKFYLINALISAALQLLAMYKVYSVIKRSEGRPLSQAIRLLYETIFADAAQSSVTFDVIFATLIWLVWILGNDQDRIETSGKLQSSNSHFGQTALVVVLSTPIFGISATAPAFLAWKDWNRERIKSE